jgi:hypothetical protein
MRSPYSVRAVCSRRPVAVAHRVSFSCSSSVLSWGTAMALSAGVLVPEVVVSSTRYCRKRPGVPVHHLLGVQFRPVVP